MNRKLKNLPASEKFSYQETLGLNSLLDHQRDVFGLPRNQNQKSQFQGTALNPPSRVTRAFSFRYRGSATTTLGQVDPSTGRLINGTVRSSRTGATAEVASPRVAGGVRETNPFSLSLSSTSPEVNGLKEGAFTMNSALPFNFRGGFLLQYWNLRYSGNQLSGQLTNTGTQFALATNLVNVTEPLAPSQITMSRGTTITGRVTTNSIQVRIQGTGVSLFSRQYAFVIDAVLSR